MSPSISARASCEGPGEIDFHRKSTGYLCHLRSGPQRPYTLHNIDFFAAYVIPKDVWYLIPARVVLGKIKKGPDGLSHAAPQGKSLPL